MYKITKLMIQTKLLLLEYATVNDAAQNHWKLATIRNIRNLLLLLDLNAEVVPVNNARSLQNLLSSLKGEDLNDNESKLVEELITI
ncbi:MAG: hypothetical protein COB12_04190 [Flavobacterium sp.]|nr:MAG: hypothetical protein COB12_04190 [Flavobacterium sp.]